MEEILAENVVWNNGNNLERNWEIAEVRFDIAAGWLAFGLYIGKLPGMDDLWTILISTPDNNDVDANGHPLSERSLANTTMVGREKAKGRAVEVVNELVDWMVTTGTLELY